MSYLKLLQDTTPKQSAVPEHKSHSSYELNEINELSQIARVRPTLAEIAEAMQLLNLCGVRIMRYDSELRLGMWEDLDGPELRHAIAAVGMHELRVVHLESAEVPIRFKIRSCPDRNPGESFEAWRQRALREAPQPTHKST
ncbi:MAG: hypothetical protein ACR2JB_23920 [Bryobacteraceae bacterium]